VYNHKYKFYYSLVAVVSLTVRIMATTAVNDCLARLVTKVVCLSWMLNAAHS